VSEGRPTLEIDHKGTKDTKSGICRQGRNALILRVLRAFVVEYVGGAPRKIGASAMDEAGAHEGIWQTVTAIDLSLARSSPAQYTAP
jgi:hypothetical protein